MKLDSYWTDTATPAHDESLARAAERMRRDVDTDIELIDRSNIRHEIDSDQFFGGLLQKRSAQMHMGRFGAGLAAAAERRGARIHANTVATRLERISTNGHAHRVHAARRIIEPKQVLVAPGATRHGAQMSVHMGQCMARVMAGEAAANPWRDVSWSAIPGHFGPPWFLPAIGLYYRLKDRLT